ncbi:MAG: hydrolase [Phycisphaeraceae bacterium]
MPTTLNHVHWIDSQAPRMQRLLTRWARINSGSTNLPGLARMADALEQPFGKLAPIRRHNLPPHRMVDATGRLIRQPLGQALSLVKRARARRRALLVIHMDTVYPADSAFQRCEPLGKDRLRGPGVVDAKGGLVVMLLALEALERATPTVRKRLGWRVILNADEELGSPGSAGLLQRAAKRCDVGLVFEPCLPDGSLVSQRKGSGNFTIVVRGRAAHAGRDFEHGRNAVAAAARLATALDGLTDPSRGITLNIAKLEGGGPLNQVPDLGIVRFNVRYTQREHERDLQGRFDQLLADVNARDGYRAVLHGSFNAPPKPLDAAAAALFEQARDCGRSLGLRIDMQPTGGVCDGNRLAAAGLPTIDTLGPRGGHLHSDREYVVLPSLVERAKLTALLLTKLADEGVT